MVTTTLIPSATKKNQATPAKKNPHLEVGGRVPPTSFFIYADILVDNLRDNSR